MNDYDVNTRKVMLAGLLGAILTVAAIMALQVLYYRYLSGMGSTGAYSQPSPMHQKMLEDQEKRLVEYRPIERSEGDADKAVVAIPIDRAMKLVVAELSRPKAKENRDER